MKTFYQRLITAFTNFVLSELSKNKVALFIANIHMLNIQNGIPRTRVRVPVEMHVFQISSIQIFSNYVRFLYFDSCLKLK